MTTIAAKFGIGKATVRRAYDHAHREKVREAAETEGTPDRDSYTKPGEDVFRKIREMLVAGMKPPQIAQEVGCGRSTVYRERRRIQAEAAAEEAA